MLTFNNENMVQQEFPFPAPIMDYIYKNVSAPQLIKLYQTCKFFYDKFKLNIIEDFEIRGCKTYQHLVGNSLAIYYENPAFAKLRNLWISKSFTFCEYFRDNYELDLGIFSRLTYNKLEMHGSYSVKKYEFLVKPPTLRHIMFDGKVLCPITDKCLSVEECIERIPHVSTINLSLETKTTPLDMTKLISLDRQTKLTSFHLDNISHIPDPLKVVEFCKKHGTSDIDYYFEIFNNDANSVKTFYKIIDTELRAWKHSLAIPLSSSFIDLTGKTAVITGAAEGIGKATVILFRQLGASVIAVARNQYDLYDLFDECQNISNAGFLHTVSLETDNNAFKLLKRIDYKFGTKFDILVNNVDTSRWYSIPDIKSKHHYSHDFYSVLQCHYNLIEEATPYLKKSKGCIINVSKTDGLNTDPEDFDIIAKLEETIKNAETDLVSSGVRINIVNPGALSTVLPRPNGMNNAAYKMYIQEKKKTLEKQAANAIAFLASDSAKLIVGSTLPML